MPPTHKKPVLLPLRPAVVVHHRGDRSQPMEGFKQHKCIISSKQVTQNFARDRDNGSDCATE